jgi:hypothetical protein
MSGDACASISTFSADNAEPRPEKLHHCGRALGLLTSIAPAEDCQIARMINRFGGRLIVLPQDLDLSGYIGQHIVMVRIDDRYLVRRVEA